MNKRTLVYLVSLAALLGLILWGGQTAQAETFRLTIGSGHPADGAIWVGAVRDFFAPEVKKRVESRTPHKIEWVAAYGGSVAKLGEVMDAVQNGLLDVGLIVIPFKPKLFIHNFSYFSPFGSPDIFQVAKVGGIVFDRVPFLKEVFEKQFNQKFLSYGTSSSYHVASNFPIKKVDDLKGKKIVGAGPNLPWIRSAGATPVQMGLGELYTGIQTGVTQGALITVDMNSGFKIYEVAKHFTLVDFGAVVGNTTTVNLDRWKKFPKEIQEIMVEVGKQHTMVETRMTKEKEAAGIEILKKAGVNMPVLSFEGKKQWANLMPEIPDQMAKDADKRGLPGSLVMKTYLDELEKDGFKFPRRWVIK